MSYQLCIDIGNTRSKAGVFKGHELIEEVMLTTADALDELLSRYPVDRCSVSKVGADPAWEAKLKQVARVLVVDGLTPLPFSNNYETPQTLGVDRIAAVAGALHFFPNTACLVIDAGTCITYDFIDAQKNYSGGLIAPGLNMRLLAMHTFTERLPLVSFTLVPDLTGKNTNDALLSGAFNGMLAEINGLIARYEETHGPLQVLLCGGDGPVFGKHIKNNIFAAPNLVLYGLNEILLFNLQ